MTQTYNRIMIAIDGSEPADKAFNKAINLAKKNNAELFIVHILDTRVFQYFTSVDETMLNETSEAAEETLIDYARRAKEAELSHVTPIIQHGLPKTLIASEIPTEYDIDLIILGATGLNAVERLLVGSVSEYVVRHALCDVLIVR